MRRLTVTEKYDDAGLLHEIAAPQCPCHRACISANDGIDECEHHIILKGVHYCTENEHDQDHR